MMGKLDIHMQRKETTCLSLIIIKKISKWIKDLNIRPKPMKLLEENSRNALGYWSWQKFGDITSKKHQEQKQH
jgi:hypothetical protein